MVDSARLLPPQPAGQTGGRSTGPCRIPQVSQANETWTSLTTARLTRTTTHASCDCSLTFNAGPGLIMSRLSPSACPLALAGGPALEAQLLRFTDVPVNKHPCLHFQAPSQYWVLLLIQGIRTSQARYVLMHMHLPSSDLNKRCSYEISCLPHVSCADFCVLLCLVWAGSIDRLGAGGSCRPQPCPSGD